MLPVVSILLILLLLLLLVLFFKLLQRQFQIVFRVGITRIQPQRLLVCLNGLLKLLILEIDVQGAMQVFENFPAAEGILVLPPSTEELKRRLRDRGRDDADTIENRLAKAEWEITQARACANFKYTIVNSNLEDSIEELVKLLSASRKCES